MINVYVKESSDGLKVIGFRKPASDEDNINCVIIDEGYAITGEFYAYIQSDSYISDEKESVLLDLVESWIRSHTVQYERVVSLDSRDTLLIHCQVETLSGDSTFYIYNSDIQNICGDVNVIMLYNSRVQNVYSNAIIKFVMESTIHSLMECAKVKYVAVNSVIHTVESEINKVYNRVKLGTIKGNARIGKIVGLNIDISEVKGQAVIDEIVGLVNINTVTEKAFINRLGGESKIKYLKGGSCVQSVEDMGVVEIVESTSTIKSVEETATVMSAEY